jgi:hypothetical protein
MKSEKEAELQEAAAALIVEELPVEEEIPTDSDNDYTDALMFAPHGERGQPEQYDRKVREIT